MSKNYNHIRILSFGRNPLQVGWRTDPGERLRTATANCPFYLLQSELKLHVWNIVEDCCEDDNG